MSFSSNGQQKLTPSRGLLVGSACPVGKRGVNLGLIEIKGPFRRDHASAILLCQSELPS